jgi:hypothetical protein
MKLKTPARGIAGDRFHKVIARQAGIGPVHNAQLAASGRHLSV